MSVARKSMLKDSKAFFSCKVRRAFAAPVITGRFDLLRIKLLCFSKQGAWHIWGRRNEKREKVPVLMKVKSDAAIRLRRL